jgi:hypothetical protein
MMASRFHQDEDGIALVMALLGIVILSGLTVVFLGRATTETKVSATSRDHEATLHVAEAAADEQISRVNRLDAHVTVDRDGLPVTFSGAADERAWALGLLGSMRPDGVAGAASPAWLETDRGQSYAVRPRDDAGEPLDLLFAVGAVPSFDAPNPRIRVLKLQVDQDRWVPRYALMTDGSLKFGGNAAIVVPGCDPSAPVEVREAHCVADVHTNDEFTNSGSASTIQGRVSQSVGSCPSAVTAVNGCVDSSDGVAAQPVPPFKARDFYNRGDVLRSDPEGQSVEWFDLCPPGKPAAGATVRRPGATPCAPGSDLVWPTAENPGSSFRGWSWQAGDWRGGAIGAGVFYVHHADAKVVGSDGTLQRAASILVEQDPANKTGSGSLDISGNPSIQAALPGVLLLADADLDMQGNAQAGTCLAEPRGFSGFIGVGEQLKTMGTVNLRGAIIVRDHEDVHGLVKRNNDGVQGTMCLEYDASLVVDFTGKWVITFWNEL